MEKLPADRFATAHEFAEALQGRVVAAPSASGAPGAVPRARTLTLRLPTWRSARAVAPWALALLGVAVGVWGWSSSRRGTPARTVRFALAFPSWQQLWAPTGAPLAISPDGRAVAYAATDSSGNAQLFVRAIDQLQPRMIPNTEFPRFPVFSPDGKWIAFHSGAGLKKVAVDGGPVATLAELSLPGGITWGTTGTIVVAVNGALKAVPSVGGAPRQISQSDVAKGETDQRWPMALPDGETVLYMSTGSAQGATGKIAAVSVSTGRRTSLDLQGSHPLGVVEGRLIYAAQGVGLMAVPFDARRLRTTSAAVPVVENVVLDPLGGARAALSASGALVYESGQAVGQPVLVDAHGATTPFIREAREFADPRFSPDGRRVAFTISSATSRDIWIYDVPKGTLTRLTTEGLNQRPEWTPDGKRLLFRSERANTVGIWWQPADGSGPAEPLFKPDVDPFEAVMSPNGQYLVYRTGPGAKYPRDILYVALEGDRTPKPLVTSLFNEQMPRLSPDGHWLAYSSNSSGRNEIYVRSFPDPGGLVQVSSGGGTEPLWDRSGRALYYRRAQQVIAASVTTTPTFSIGAHRVVFEGDYLTNPSHPNYDVAPDGAHFVMVKRAGASQTVVVLNWIQEVRARTAVHPGS